MSNPNDPTQKHIIIWEKRMVIGERGPLQNYLFQDEGRHIFLCSKTSFLS